MGVLNNNYTSMTEKICNICGDEIDDLKPDEIQKLSCGHEYCDDCILEWFKKIVQNIKVKNGYHSNYKKYNECPTCRKSGGYLKLREGQEFFVHVHGPKKPERVTKEKFLNSHICCAPLKTVNDDCTCTGKKVYGYYCGTHKSWANIIPKKIDEIEKILAGEKPSTTYKIPSKAIKCCGELKNGGKCKYNGKEKYGYYCGIHKKYAITNPKIQKI
jgi:hypothetical protein